MQEDPFLPNPILRRVIEKLEDDIHALEAKYTLPRGYLRTAFTIHLPQFSQDQLFFGNGKVNKGFAIQECEYVANRVENNLHSFSDPIKKLLLNNIRESKVTHSSSRIQEVHDNDKITEIAFKKVDPEIGMSIQEKLHYIGCSRSDSLFHFGLFREGDKFPFAYAAFSKLDRQYLQDVLLKKFGANVGNVLVLSRLFNINCAPQNSLSLLMSLCSQYFRDDYVNLKFDMTVSAVNPNMFFSGSAFTGSNFAPFATAPFAPLYYQNNYVTRKWCLANLGTEDKELLKAKYDVTPARIPLKPTVWLAKGVLPEYVKICGANDLITGISSHKYNEQ